MKRAFATMLGLSSALLLASTTAAGPFESAMHRLRRISNGGTRTLAEQPSQRTSHAARSTEGRPLPYAAEIRSAARRHGVPPSMLAALVRVESNFDPRAVSSAGARGLGQLMPGTARELGVSDSFDPVANLDGAARYLARQLGRFGSAHRALAAYHAGPARVSSGYAYLPRETYEYVSRVLSADLEYRERGLP